MWWLLLRNHPPGTTLSPVPAATPPPSGSFVHATSWGGTLLVAIFGAALLLIAPWLTRGVVTAGCWLARSLLGPGTLTQRVRDLEQARARGVDDLAALLRQVERDLHDGARVRPAAMAMNLGMAKEKLGADGQAADGRAPDVERARELVGAAHLGAKEALVELRELVRGIHPPVLEVGLAEALATLAAGSAIPVRVTAGLPARPCRPSRPSPASARPNCWPTRPGTAARARSAYVRISPVPNGRRCSGAGVCDDGRGGADPAGGSGLPGLGRRVGTVDGRLTAGLPYRPKSGLGRIGNWYRWAFRG